MNKIAPLIVFFVIGFFLFLSLNSDPNKLPSPLVGKKFPVIEGVDFYTNENIKLNDLINNQFALVNVWASWCVTCRKEHQMIMNIAENNQLKLIGINYKDLELNAENFLEDLGNPYDLILNDDNGKLSIIWGAYGVPETFIVFNNKIVKKYTGPLNEVNVQEIKKILSQ